MRDYPIAFMAVLAVVVGRFAYVQITDRFSVAAAKGRCTPESVVEVRQHKVWTEYMRELKRPTLSSDSSAQRDRVRKALGIGSGKLFQQGQDFGYSISNANGEIARITYIAAYSAAFSVDGPPIQIFSCLKALPATYEKFSFAF